MMLVLWFVVALLLVGGAWAGALFGLYPTWVAVTVTVLALGALVLAVGLRARAGKRRAARRTSELGHSDAARTRDDAAEAPGVLEIRASMRALVSSLRRNHSRFSDAPLYALPWYLMLGPTGSGKSTVLGASGLPLSAAGSRRAPQPGAATKGCEPWICDGAVLLDTAGGYALGDDDAEWDALLDTLARERPRRPLDGVVLVYAAPELLGQTPEQTEQKARRTRARLEQLAARLGSLPPVYLLLSKTDEVPGFTEFFADLDARSAEGAFGATLDARGAEDPVASFKAEFDVLKLTLHSYLLAHLPDRRQSPEACAQTLRFPVEFEALRAPLAKLVEQLFRSSSYQELPTFRGFYFCASGHAAPVPAFAVGPATRFAVHTTEAPRAGRSFFLTGLFRGVIFPDRGFGARSTGHERRQLRQRALLAAVGVALLLVAVVPAAASCIANLDRIDASIDDVRRARQLARGSRDEAGRMNALEVLLARASTLRTESERLSVPHWLGPYTAEPLADAVWATYLGELRAFVHGPLRERIVSAIRSSTNSPGLDPGGFKTAYEQLQLYLMLTHPDRLSPELAKTALAEIWARESGGHDGATGIAAHASNYVDALARDASWAWPEDGTLVMRARAKLASMPLEELAYGTLERAAAGAPPVLPEHIFTGESARYLQTRGKVEVPGLYTQLGWEKVQPLLEPDEKTEFAGWVLGRDASEAPAWGSEQLTKLYFDRYIRAWMDFLVGLDVITPTSLNAAVAELSALSKGEGPYVRLFRRLAENVRLTLPAPGMKEQALGTIAQVTRQVLPAGQAPAPQPERRVSPVEQYFRRMVRFGFGDATPAPGVELPPSLLNQYLEQLRALEVSLRQLQEYSIEPTAEFGAELARTSGSVERLLAGFDQTERLALEPLLLNPIRGSQRVVEDKGRAALNDRWRLEVWEPYRRIITRYPFTASGSDVSLADFAEFFRPETGTLWRFYGETLAGRLTRAGVRFVPRPTEVKAGFRSDFLACLSGAQQIAEAVFVDGATEPKVPFKVKMQSVDARVSETTLEIDGERLVYRNEPEKWRALAWPGADGPAGAALRVKGADFEAVLRREDGEFGFFRLLAAGNVEPVSPGSLTLEARWDFSFKGSESHVTIQFQASRQRHPFSPNFFTRLQCPSAITTSTAR